MTTLLIAERVTEEARVLVLGAGGGLELKAFAQAYPGWSFDGVDPAAEMLKLAQRTLGPLRLAHLYIMATSTTRQKGRLMPRRVF
jgi:tRNA (cmo5U34)-methyltransferase